MKAISKIAAAAVMLSAMTALPGTALAVPTSPCEVRVSDDTVEEGDSGTTMLRFVVSAYGCGAGSVEYQTEGPNSGYQAAHGILQWVTSNAGTDRVVEVAVFGDTIPESDESVWFSVFAPSGVTVVDPTGIGTVRDDDGEEEALTEVIDVVGDGVPHVVLSRTVRVDVTVLFATADGSALAGEDYEGVTRGRVVVPAGQISAPIRITTRRDHLPNGPEYFHVRIFEPSHGKIVLSQQRVIIPLP